jgi:chorismate mutase
MFVDPQLAQLRAAMDRVNRRLVDTLHERARLCRTIGAFKRTAGLTAVDPAREAEMLAAMLENAPAGGFSAQQLAAILARVFEASRQIVEGRDDAAPLP